MYYKRGKSLGDILIRAKLYGRVSHYHKLMSRVWPVNTFHLSMEFLSLSRRRSSSQNVASGEEQGEMAVITG